MCVSASASEVVETPGASVPFSLEQILVEMEGGRYIGPILPVSLADIITGRRSVGGGGPKSGGGGGSGNSDVGGGGRGGNRNKKPSPKVDATGGPAQVQACYDAHLPPLPLRDGENLRSILAGAVLPTLYAHVLYKNWHLCRVCWKECDRKNLHVPTPPEVATNITGLLKVDQGGMTGVPAA